tara:strand:- start:204 stop:626 length:423 start_codon:yes stop_codon:yes gene_type:complete
MSEQFKKGDLVVYAGYTDKIEGVTKAHYRLGIVRAVGKYELFVIDQNKSIYNSSFRVPKECAQVIDRTAVLPRAKDVRRPKLGDLVLYYNEGNHTGIVEDHGVLVSLTDIPGQLQSVKVRKGKDESSHSYKDIIVLEHAK